jgi:hypothetical protein
MATFVKRPVIVEAVQYVEYGKLVRGMCNSQSCYTSGNNQPHVHTIHNNQIVLLEVGDWILEEPDGKHFSLCKPDTFAATYLPVVEGGKLSAESQEEQKERTKREEFAYFLGEAIRKQKEREQAWKAWTDPQTSKQLSESN